MRRPTRLTGFCAAAALAWACGDGGGGERPAPSPAPAPAPAPTPEPAPPPAPEPAPAEGGGAPDAAAGAAHYANYCVECHGDTGQGDGAGARDLPVSPRDFSKGEFKFDADGNGTAGEDADLRLVIANGAAAYEGSGLMMGWAGPLDEQAIDDVVAYVRSLEK